jgi:hypothetical protein
MKNFKINWVNVVIEIICFSVAFIIGRQIAERFNLYYIVELVIFLVILYALKGLCELFINKKKG